MSDLWLKIVTITIGSGLFIISWITIENHPEPQKFIVPTQFKTNQSPFYSEQFIPKHQTAMVHAAQANSTPEGITAYWFAGSREGARDVQSAGVPAYISAANDTDGAVALERF